MSGRDTQKRIGNREDKGKNIVPERGRESALPIETSDREQREQDRERERNSEKLKSRQPARD